MRRKYIWRLLLTKMSTGPSPPYCLKSPRKSKNRNSVTSRPTLFKQRKTLPSLMWKSPRAAWPWAQHLSARSAPRRPLCPRQTRQLSIVTWLPTWRRPQRAAITLSSTGWQSASTSAQRSRAAALSIVWRKSMLRLSSDKEISTS